MRNTEKLKEMVDKLNKYEVYKEVLNYDQFEEIDLEVGQSLKNFIKNNINEYFHTPKYLIISEYALVAYKDTIVIVNRVGYILTGKKMRFSPEIDEVLYSESMGLIGVIVNINRRNQNISRGDYEMFFEKKFELPRITNNMMNIIYQGENNYFFKETFASESGEIKEIHGEWEEFIHIFIDTSNRLNKFLDKLREILNYKIKDTIDTDSGYRVNLDAPEFTGNFEITELEEFGNYMLFRVPRFTRFYVFSYDDEFNLSLFLCNVDEEIEKLNVFKGIDTNKYNFYKLIPINPDCYYVRNILSLQSIKKDNFAFKMLSYIELQIVNSMYGFMITENEEVGYITPRRRIYLEKCELNKKYYVLKDTIEIIQEEFEDTSGIVHGIKCRLIIKDIYDFEEEDIIVTNNLKEDQFCLVMLLTK